MFEKLSYDVDREKLMDDFIKNDCVACGGNWSAMIISGMKYSHKYWWLYDELEDNRSYSFFELVDMVYKAIDERVKNNIENNNRYLRERIANRMIDNGYFIGEYTRSNQYASCTETVVQYLGNYWLIQFVDGCICKLEKTTLEYGQSLNRKTELRRYE